MNGPRPRRTVIEIMVLTFTFVVCFILLLTSVSIAIVEINDPTVDTDKITQSLISLVSGILGALLGLIAGRSAAASELQKKDDE